MEVYVDLSGIVQWCSSIGQSSQACTGLVRGRQKTRWSTNQQGHSPIVSMHHNTCSYTTMTHKPTKICDSKCSCYIHAKVLFACIIKKHRSRAARFCVRVCRLFGPPYCTDVCVFVRAHKRPRVLSPYCWPCNLFDIVSVEYPCCPSPLTWLPGNRNGVPLSFTFQVKCTSVSQLLQPMSTGATAE